MEIFIEQMVKKKKSLSDILVVLLLALGSSFVAFLLLNLSVAFSAFGSIFFLLVAGVFYFAYVLATSRNLEYEYSMVNHEIDIDKIANQKKRKRLTTINVKKLEAFGRKCKSADFNRYASDASVKKLYACADKNSEDVFYAVYLEDSVKKMILFDPNERIVEMIVKLNPREVFEV